MRHNTEEEIVRVVGSSPTGMALDEILRQVALPRRTLQRRLAELVAKGRLRIEGQRKGTRYFLPAVGGQLAVTLAPGVASASGEVYVPLSPEGESVRRVVKQPLQLRRPVGYDRSFLDRYRPNGTHYLEPALRERLHSLGQAPSQQELPAGTYARQIFNRLLIDLSWNSSRLEGNTYSLLETERLLQIGQAVEGKDALEAQMLLNHKQAIEFLIEQAPELGFNRYTVLNLHALLSQDLLPDPLACGRLRRIPVAITESVFHPLEGPQLLDEVFQQVLDTASAIRDPIEQAFFAMVHLPYLQPFEDVNKRVSRLAANLPLMRENLSPLSFVDVPARAYVDALLGVYELNRVELLRDVFVWAYERSCARYSAVRQSLGEPDPFRLRHRAFVSEVVTAVVRSRLGKVAAATLARSKAAEHANAEEAARLVELIETELMGLHEGNIARYRLRPSEYAAWAEGWR